MSFCVPFVTDPGEAVFVYKENGIPHYLDATTISTHCKNLEDALDKEKIYDVTSPTKMSTNDVRAKEILRKFNIPEFFLDVEQLNSRLRFIGFATSTNSTQTVVFNGEVSVKSYWENPQMHHHLYIVIGKKPTPSSTQANPRYDSFQIRGESVVAPMEYFYTIDPNEAKVKEMIKKSPYKLDIYDEANGNYVIKPRLTLENMHYVGVLKLPPRYGVYVKGQNSLVEIYCSCRT